VYVFAAVYTVIMLTFWWLWLSMAELYEPRHAAPRTPLARSLWRSLRRGLPRGLHRALFIARRERFLAADLARYWWARARKRVSPHRPARRRDLETAFERLHTVLDRLERNLSTEQWTEPVPPRLPRSQHLWIVRLWSRDGRATPRATSRATNRATYDARAPPPRIPERASGNASCPPRDHRRPGAPAHDITCQPAAGSRSRRQAHHCHRICDRCEIALPIGGAIVGDERPVPGDGHDGALRLEHAQGLAHRRHRHPILVSQGQDRRQPAGFPLADERGQLKVGRHGPVAVDHA
jgi:hypothetical protein